MSEMNRRRKIYGDYRKFVEHVAETIAILQKKQGVAPQRKQRKDKGTKKS